MDTTERNRGTRAGWRFARRALVGAAVFTTLAAAFYTVENRRGRLAWAQCRKELEARGEKLAWQDFVPPRIPDESNFFRAPGMTAWFSRQTATNPEPARLFAVSPVSSWGNWPLTLADLRALPEQPVAGSSNTVSRAQLRERFAGLCPEYDLLAEACARPHSRLADDYSVPYRRDLPNFVNVRAVAQALAVRASLNLLDGRPEAALKDLTMMRRLGEVMGNDSTLVGTMIGVAIVGLHNEAARGGLEARLWGDTELAAIQDRTRDVNLLRSLAGSIRGGERAGVLDLLDRPRSELARAFSLSPGGTGSRSVGAVDWPELLARLELELCPQGWIRQNQVSMARIHQQTLDAFDPETRRIHGSRVGEARIAVISGHERFTGYRFLADLATPNFIRALQTLGRNQTQLDQLRVACALERWRLAHGSHPETLDALVPAYLDRIPNDLFADRSLQYRRDEKGGYQLWSVGWDEQDEGGVPAADKEGRPIYDTGGGDWVWVHSNP